MTWDRVRYHQVQAEVDSQRAEAGATCLRCRTPYRVQDLVETRPGRMVCRWHYDRGAW